MTFHPAKPLLSKAVGGPNSGCFWPNQDCSRGKGWKGCVVHTHNFKIAQSTYAKSVNVWMWRQKHELQMDPVVSSPVASSRWGASKKVSIARPQLWSFALQKPFASSALTSTGYAARTRQYRDISGGDTCVKKVCKKSSCGKYEATLFEKTMEHNCLDVTWSRPSTFQMRMTLLYCSAVHFGPKVVTSMTLLSLFFTLNLFWFVALNFICHG